MNEHRHSTMPPLDQPGYWQFYENSEGVDNWTRRQLAAGNRLIGVGLGGLMILSAIWTMLALLH